MKWIKDLFSRRPAAAAHPLAGLPRTFRHRLLMYCTEQFRNSQMGDYSHQFWEEIHEKLRYQHGRPVLATEQRSSSVAEDALAFLDVCQTEYFLDFVEQIFRVDTFFRAAKSDTEIVDDINTFFALDDLPYALTEYAHSEGMETSYLGTHLTRRVVAYPQIVRKENQFVYSEAIAPTLELLAQPEFRSANQEFRLALEDYRRGDFSDCLVKCGSALESVLKIVCAKKKWQYNEKDTLAPLLKTVIANTSLPPFFEQPLIIVGTMRNKLSSAHGGGTDSKTVPQHIAKYALTATAAAILLIADASR